MSPWSLLYRLATRLATRLVARVQRSRQPDFTIGEPLNPYLRRWYLTPWSGLYRDVERKTWWQRLVSMLPGVYVHQFLRSDDDRALHDHPWPWATLLVHGSYTEHRIAAGGVHHREVFDSGTLRAHWPSYAHRIELHAGPCVTLFFTGPRVGSRPSRLRGDRSWGFHCRDGWRDWREFTDPATNGATVGRGCD